jgi:hypothetical protein
VNEAEVGVTSSDRTSDVTIRESLGDPDVTDDA